MPPIPIHKDAPIAPSTTAAKADGVTPSTAALNPEKPPPTRTTPAYAPATTTASSSEPPAPQPGARPAAPTGNTGGVGHSASTPALPQPAPTATATVYTTETRLGGPPAQFTQPPPTDSALAGRSTTTATTMAHKSGPTTLNMGMAASPFQTADSSAPTQTSAPDAGRRSLEHPPGYVQAPDNAPYTSGGGIGAQDRSAEQGGDEGVGATAWNMLSKAGEALKKGEEAAWRAVKGK